VADSGRFQADPGVAVHQQSQIAHGELVATGGTHQFPENCQQPVEFDLNQRIGRPVPL